MSFEFFKEYVIKMFMSKVRKAFQAFQAEIDYYLNTLELEHDGIIQFVGVSLKFRIKNGDDNNYREFTWEYLNPFCKYDLLDESGMSILKPINKNSTDLSG